VERTTGRSEERAAWDKGARGEMAAAANVEWGGLTAARRCHACVERASRKIFLREMGETYRGGGRLVGPVARAGPGSGVRSDGRLTLSISVFYILNFVNCNIQTSLYSGLILRDLFHPSLFSFVSLIEWYYSIFPDLQPS